MLGAIAAGIGALLGGGGAAAVGLGSSILGGVGALAGGAGSLVGGAVGGASSLVSGGVSTLGGLLGGGATEVGLGSGMARMGLAEGGSAASATAAGGGLVSGVSGIAGQLAEILPVVGSAVDIFYPQKSLSTHDPKGDWFRQPDISHLSGVPMETLPTLPALTQTGGRSMFTTPGLDPGGEIGEGKLDYMPLVIIAMIAVLFLSRKR